MNIALGFIKRPVMTTLVMLAILLAGVMGYRALPVNDLPSVDFPTLNVSAGLPGASPETMASSVATPLERQFATISGIDSMTSSNSKGSTRITLQFDLSRNIDAAAQDVQAAISQTIGRLPKSMPNPPTFRKSNPADSPIIYFALFSDTLALSTIDQYAETFMAQRISMIDGVAQVNIYGSQKYAVRIQLDPKAMAARSIGIDEVASAVQNGNVNLPTGDLEGPHQAFTIQANGQLENAQAYRPLIVAYRGGRPVRLEELGNVVNSVENVRSASWFNDSRSIVLAVQRQPGTNTIEVVDAIKKMLPTFRNEIPPAIKIETLYDRSESIRESVNDVKFTLILTVILVVLVIFAFLRNLSATLIPSLALPMSLIGTFAVMYLFGFSVDNLSLMALTLSVGFVVDDAIVMLENIVRHEEMGKPRLEAAVVGAREIGFTIVSMTLSLTAVFIPILFMGGIIGRLLHEFAITIMTAILISGFISLSLTPMLCSRYLRSGGKSHHGHLYAITEKFFDGMLYAYDATLKLALRLRPLMLLLFVGLLGLTVWVFTLVPRGFLPTEDAGRLQIQTEAAQGTSFQAMVGLQQAAAAIVLKNPAVDNAMSAIRGDNGGFLFVRLKPIGQRPPAEVVVNQLRGALAQIPGLSSFVQIPPSINIGGRGSKSQYQYTLQSPSIDDLYEYAPKLEARLAELPQLVGVTSDQQNQNPQVNIKIDRDKASALGLTANQIEAGLFTAYGTRQVSTFYTPEDTYQVIMELAPKYQSDPNVLDELYLRAGSGKLVPLSTIATLSRDVGPLSISHQGQLPAVTISYDTAEGVSLSEANALVEKTAAEVLPDTITPTFAGTAQAFEESTRNLGILLLMAVLVIYIVLGILYESFIHPLTILTGLPPAGLGALASLWLFHMELDLYSFVGIIMLVGIVKKNAIMMIDFALEEQKTGVAPAEAIYRGCLIRFRPIMMTTAAALMGALPIALGLGAGAESRRPLGVAIVGGLLVSQFLTLYITPVFYIYMEKLRRVFRPREVAVEPDAAPAGGQ